MLLVGDKSTIPEEGYVVYNISSLVEGYERINILPPLQIFQMCGNDEKLFDIKYAEYIMSNPNVFNELMKIMYSLYYGKDVYLLVTRDGGYFDILTESLLKFIQQRYGYDSYILNDPEDILYADKGEFNIYGLFNFDQDNKRYVDANAEQLLGGQYV